VGDGANTLFWTDKWLHGERISELAPRLFGIIPKRFAQKRTVQEALSNGQWIADIRGGGGSLLKLYQVIFVSGRCFLVLSCNLTGRISTFSALLQIVDTLQSLPIKVFLWDHAISGIISECGKHGLHQNIVLLFGLLLRSDVGQQIDSPRED
jgi:hypothetical protein